MRDSALDTAASRARGEFDHVNVDTRHARLMVSEADAERWTAGIQPHQCIRQINVGGQHEPPFFYHGVVLVPEHAGPRQRALDLMRRWRGEDEQEQRETFEFLERALDEDRPSSRKLFP